MLPSRCSSKHCSGKVVPFSVVLFINLLTIEIINLIVIKYNSYIIVLILDNNIEGMQCTSELSKTIPEMKSKNFYNAIGFFETAIIIVGSLRCTHFSCVCSYTCCMVPWFSILIINELLYYAVVYY